MRGVNPIDVGVGAAAQTVLPGDVLPTYVKRSLDADACAAIRAAFEGTGPSVVVAVGRSKVGKSRTMFEALREVIGSGDVSFVAPTGGDALTSLMTPGTLPEMDERSVLWLDDLEAFLNDGVTQPTLREWCTRFPKSIVVATYGGRTIGASTAELTTIATEVLQQARELHLVQTTPRELDPLRSNLSPDVLRSMEQHGLAAYFVAASLLERKLSTGRHEGETECPEGVAIVHASADWARCGRTDPIPDAALRELWADHLPSHVPASDDNFAVGLAWATRPVAGSIALVEYVASYRAFDYVVEVIDRSSAVPPQLSTWGMAIRGASDAQALAIAERAYSYEAYEHALTASQVARSSDDVEVSAIGTLNCGVILGTLDRQEEALSLYEEVLGMSEVRPAVFANALLGRSAALGGLGRHAEAVSAADELLHGIETADPRALAYVVAPALSNKGVSLVALDRSDEALLAFDEALSYLPDRSDPRIREAAARALLHKGTTLNDLGRDDEALRVFDEVCSQFRRDAAPQGVRRRVHAALIYKGDALVEKGSYQQALDAYDLAQQRLRDPSESLTREALGRARIGRGNALVGLGRLAEARAELDDVLADLGEDQEPVVRQLLVKTLRAKMNAVSESDAETELAMYDEVLDRLGGADEPEARELVATALVVRGSTLAVMGREQEALLAYDRAVSYCQRSSEPLLRAAAILALSLKLSTYVSADRHDDAVNTYSTVKARLGEPPELDVSVETARAIVAFGEMLRTLDRYEETLAALDFVVERTADRSTGNSQLRSVVRQAWAAKGEALAGLHRFDEALAVLELVLSDASLFDVSAGRSYVGRASALGALERHQDALATWDELLSRLVTPSSGWAREVYARALLGRGITLGALGRHAEALDAWNVLTSSDTSDGASPIDALVAEALLRTGLLLKQLDRLPEALLAFDEIRTRSLGADSPQLRTQTVEALVGRGSTLSQLGELDEAIASFDEALARANNEGHLSEMVARALEGRGTALKDLGRYAEALVSFDQLLANVGSSMEPPAWAIARAMLNRGVVLGVSGRTQDALATWDGLVARFGDSPAPELREATAMAINNRAVALTALGRPVEAVAAYDDLLQRFQDTSDSALRPHVATALREKASLLSGL